MSNTGKKQKSLFQIKMENEAKAKEKIEKEQIKELNRAMIQGLDLNKAAKSIYGPGPDTQKNQEKGNNDLKSKDNLKFNKNWTE